MSRSRCVAVAVFTIFSGVFFIYWSVPDVLAAFGVVGALTLYCTARGMVGSGAWFVAAAAFAALSHLARPDGVLLLALLLGMMVVRHLGRARGPAGDGRSRPGWPSLAGLATASAAVYLLVLSPWLFQEHGGDWRPLAAVG